ncbi:MAG: hypothetical protein ACMG57_01845 [Candidatus Dojkabacteria bacterium]
MRILVVIVTTILFFALAVLLTISRLPGSYSFNSAVFGFPFPAFQIVSDDVPPFTTVFTPYILGFIGNISLAFLISILPIYSFKFIKFLNKKLFS